jgi:hypothetical protein
MGFLHLAQGMVGATVGNGKGVALTWRASAKEYRANFAAEHPPGPQYTFLDMESGLFI